MRWVWRSFAALGIAALLGLTVWFVVAEVRLHREITHICSQFTNVDCAYHRDGRTEGRVGWNPETKRWETRD